MREVYVYYRLAAADAERCARAVDAFQARLAHELPGLRARRLVRPETPGGEATWMETYARDGSGVDPALQARIEADAAAVTAPWRRGPRHVEVFIAAP